MLKERRLKRELRLIGLKSGDVAKRLDVTRQTFNNWCAGRTTIPADVVLKLREIGISETAIKKPYEILTFQ